MVRAGEIEHGLLIAGQAERVWNWASPAGTERARRRAELILAAAGVNSDARVLELGCGTGLFTRTFARTGCQIVALDVSEPLLEQARARTDSPRVEYRLGDAEQLEEAEASFEAVLGSSILHHLNLEPALAEMFRVLKPAGRCAFAEPNMMNPQIALQRNVPFLRRWAGESPEETAFFRGRLARRLRATGFVDVRVTPFDFLHPAVPASLIGIVDRVGRFVEHVPGLREISGSLLISGSKPA